MPFHRPRIHTIRKINQETPTVKSYVFNSDVITREAQPGQFLMLWIPGVDEFPISIASAYNSRVEIAVSKVGKGTEALHQIKEGDYIGIRGPYGSYFDLKGEKLLAVAGGYGSSAIRHLVEKGWGKEFTVLLGAKTSNELLYKDKFEKFAKVKVATDDGSEGYKGLVTDLLSELFKRENFDQVFTCGPEAMMKKVCEITAKYKKPTQVCVERIVKCARGFCGSCDLGGYRVCKEGPVFDAEKLRETEFGRWTRSKSGKRIQIEGIVCEDFSSFPSDIFIPEYDPLLETELCGVKLPNPLMNAAGLGFSGKMLFRYAKGGAGAIVTKSIGLKEREGYDGSNFIEITTLTPVNAMGLPNPKIENYKLEIEDMKAANVPIVLSVFGQTPEECGKVAEIGIGYGIAMIEINVSCPHTELATVEKNPELVKEITQRVSQIAHPKEIPVSIKISPNEDYIEVAKAAEEGGANAITAINTIRVRPMNSKLNIPILGSSLGYGGKSGKGIREISEKILKDLYAELEIPIISTGGIFSYRDAINRFTNGAIACQIGTAIGYKGVDVFKEIAEGLKSYLRRNNYDNIKEIIGIESER